MLSLDWAGHFYRSSWSAATPDFVEDPSEPLVVEYSSAVLFGKRQSQSHRYWGYTMTKFRKSCRHGALPR